MSDQEQEFSKDDLSLVPDADTEAPESKTESTTTTPVDAKADSTKTQADSTPTWNDKWREDAINNLGLKDEKERKRAEDWLTKRSSPYEVIRAGLAADQKISELTRDRVKIPTGKNDDPKEVAAFRKAMGIPEKPDDYQIEIPKEYGDLSDFDKELVDEFRKEAHAAGMNQKGVEVASKMYWSIQQRIEAAKMAEAVVKDQAGEDEIRVRHGKEFRARQELTNRMIGEGLEKHGWSAEERKDFFNMRLENGQRLGTFPPFVNWLFELAQERADDGAFVVGEGDDGEDLDAKISSMIELQHSNPKEYQRIQPDLQRLIAAQNRRKARGR